MGAPEQIKKKIKNGKKKRKNNCQIILD